MLKALIGEVSPQERDTLVALYNSTGGANWTDSTNWNIGDPCTDSWYGVTCDNGIMKGLNLSSNQLTGSIPVELGNLTNLVGLYLDNDQLTGSIPIGITSLTNLYLYQNCNLYSDDIDVQQFIDDVKYGGTYQNILDTNSYDCDSSAPILAPVIMYLLN